MTTGRHGEKEGGTAGRGESRLRVSGHYPRLGGGGSEEGGEARQTRSVRGLQRNSGISRL